MKETLFPVDLPSLEWVEFSAEGFSESVVGVIHRSGRPAVCGLALGGIDTGCIDLETIGTLGYCTIFNSHVPRRGPLNLPFLGMSVGSSTWVLTTQKMDGVQNAKEIHYWGHYPVADLEYEINAPVSVGLRTWAPFLPGDTAISNTPGGVFEVHLRNTTDAQQQGAIAISFPGPTEAEAGTNKFVRQEVTGAFNGVTVTTPSASYALGVQGYEKLRIGGELGMDGGAWARIARELPLAANQPGASVAVDFELAPKETKTVRFVLAWYSPQWKGGGTPTAGGNTYTHMYASRYKNALEIAQLLSLKHESLLRRILGWQQVIYTDQHLPTWLRETLINNLYMITEDGFWAQALPPIGEWCRPEDGLFGLNECPRLCPQIECIPCSFYGNIPIVYFFPELALSTLRGYKAYQYPDGAAPWIFGGVTGGTEPCEMAKPTRGYQTTLNGPCYVDMVDRYWLRTGNDDFLREFYPSVKKNTIFTMNLRGADPDGVISMPTVNDNEWIEACDWFGMVTHVGGIHLANLRMAQRMAEKMGDKEFVQQCQDWLDQGTNSMENKMWAGQCYLVYNEPETGKISPSDVVLGNQLDGEWMADFHGLPGVFRDDRVKTTLDTVKQTCATVAPYGATIFANADGTPVPDSKFKTGYGSYALFCSEFLMLTMTYMYHDERDFGLELARRGMYGMICKQRLSWALPCFCRADTGEANLPASGADYYQMMMLWSLPAAVEGKDLSEACAEGGLIDRVLKAAISS